MPLSFTEKILPLFNSQKRTKKFIPGSSIQNFVKKRPVWVQGAITVSEMEFLYNSILHAKPKNIVEVGVASGNSTATILKAMADLRSVYPKYTPHLHAFDIVSYCYFDKNIAVGQAVDEMIPEEKDHLSLHNHHSVLDFYRIIEKGSIDFLFIDANHNHPWPCIDLFYALPYLSRQAVVCFHDINLPYCFPEFPCWGVKYLFDHIKAKKTIIEAEKPNIGLFTMGSTSSKAIAKTIDHVLNTYEWQTEIPQAFLSGIKNKSKPDNFSKMKKITFSFQKNRPSSPIYTQTPLVICAQQRSGTNALRSILGQHDQINDFNEVFNDRGSGKNNTLPQSNFFRFYRNLILKYPDLTIPNKENKRLIWDYFMKHLSSLSPKDFMMLDIKYNSWHHFNTTWHNPSAEPHLMNLLKRRDIQVIHLLRKNTFRQYLSGRHAVLSQKWHYQDNTEIDRIPFSIDVKQCENFLKKIQKTTELYTSWLEYYPHCLQLSYEDLFDGVELQEEAKIALQNFLQLDSPLSSQSLLKKSPIDYAELIENKEEVIEHFTSSPFAEMVNSLLVR